MQGKPFFSESLKREVVREVKTGLISKADAKRKYGIKGNSTIIGWIRNFEGKDPDTKMTSEYKKSDKDDLIKRIKKLERKLEDEQIRSNGLSKMIDIAEDQLNISIRKKSTTKQSKK